MNALPPESSLKRAFPLRSPAAYPSVLATDPGTRRWVLSFLVVLSVHVGPAAMATWWMGSSPPAPPAAGLVMEIALTPVAAETPPPAPMPEITEPPKPEPPPEPDPVVEDLPPPPVIDTAEVKLKKPEKPKEPEPVQELPPPPAPPLPTVAAPKDIVTAAPQEGAPSFSNSDEKARWQSMLLGHLERHKRYPVRAQARRQEGMPMVRFTMDREGNVQSARLEQATRYSLLNEEALTLFERATPLPPPPPSMPGETVELVVPIEFFMRR